MKAIVFVQARLNSRRLPGKAALPINNVPMCVLAAQRAGNTGLQVVVLTSDKSSDNPLCKVLQDWEIPYFRGDLNNPLSRFAEALRDFGQEQIVVRLTGDNVLPDGLLINKVIEQFNERKLKYISTNSIKSGLPYGVSVEVTYAKLILEANLSAASEFDREHVTPYIIRTHGFNHFENTSYHYSSNLRATIDTFNDYLKINSVFDQVGKPQNVSLTKLISNLIEKSPDVVCEKPATRLVLGTAQFGSDYGIANYSGKLSPDSAFEAVKIAISNGVKYFDTAHSYGESEKLLGEAMREFGDDEYKIITKLSLLDDCPSDATANVVKTFVQKSIYQSCVALRKSKLDFLLLHRADQLIKWQGAVLDTILDFQGRKIIDKIGVSVQTPQEALEVLKYECIQIIQLPFNILDSRWDNVIREIRRLKRTRKLIIHVRSSLLQGLLASKESSLWERALCSDPKGAIDWLQRLADIYSSGDVSALCIKFVNSQDWIDGVVLGVDNPSHLRQNLNVFRSPMFSGSVQNKLLKNRPKIPEDMLNPSLWIKSDV